MPKTEEEWKAEVERLNTKHEAEIDQYKAQQETHATKIKGLEIDVKERDAKLESFEKAERATLEAHAQKILDKLPEDVQKEKEPLDKWTNSKLETYIEAGNDFKVETHAAGSEPRGNGDPAPPADPKAALKRRLDGC